MNDEELLQYAKDEVIRLKEESVIIQREATMLLALTEAVKLRGDFWPDSLITNTLKSIDTTAWAIGSHLQKCYSGNAEEDVEENLELIEEMLTDE